MFRKGYIIRDQQAIYYMTFTIVGWIDVFSRKSYRDIFIESLKYCQQHKGLHLHAYVMMSNHIHLIVSVDEGSSISDFVRDCKKFTAKRILDDIENSTIESRKAWMLHEFKYYASRHSRNEKYQLWAHDNHFVELSSPAFTQQKIDYIHQNPVRAGLVYRAEDYVYSSASNYAGIDQIIDVDCLF
ncbi:REP element-mobilizing transposase RayT [Mucilaginibacter mallensis]|uniref:REP element-mobilizing transposase RayT n=1 Tax=Mucilaginibacter mallensis TaxID=652787 RepID=A0A1H1P396_MUCMA|nr:transposase [Mucilaginibacter mallensis]SDS05728.1 REP element-mobilizing transposase RayT [Mucilaginibacter mallensis]